MIKCETKIALLGGIFNGGHCDVSYETGHF